MDEGTCIGAARIVIPLTERLLNDAGGWQAMKVARGLHSAGRVLEAAYNPPMLQGRVREGNTEYKSGLRIGSKTDIENLCTCRESRGRGLICAHSLAVGLAVLKPITEANKVTVTPEKQTENAVAESTENQSTVQDSARRVFSLSDGIPLDLTFIFPPNLPDAWDRGGVGVMIEASIGGQRKPLNAIPPNATYRCDAIDFAAIRSLLSLTAKELPGMLTLKREQASRLLGSLIGHSRLMLGRSARLNAIESKRLNLVGALSESGLRLEVKLPDGARMLSGESANWTWTSGTLAMTAAGLPAPYQPILRQSITIPPDGLAGFLERELPVLEQFFEVSGFDRNAPIGVPTSGTTAQAGITFALKLEGSLNYLGAQLEARTERRRTTLTGPGIRPATTQEAGALQRLRHMGFDGPNAQGEWALRGEQDILRFFAQDLQDLQKDWEVTIGSRFSHVTRDLERVNPQLEIRGSGENWFEVGFELATESGQRLSANEIRRLLGSGRRTVRLPNNKTAVLSEGLLDEFQTLIQDTNPQQTQPGSYRFDRRDAIAFGAYTSEVGAKLTGAQAVAFDPGRMLFKRTAKPLELGSLEETLRSYQRDGITWLNQLAENGLSGILADEMGLGKTVQALAFMSLSKGPKLVVCPASLTLNWQREAERFTPGLKPQLLGDVAPGILTSLIQQPRLFVTSYGLLRRDIEVLRQIRFGAVILDEAQHIKNPDSQSAKAAFRLQADAKAALTGTPIENGVRDIWSIMNFLMPGYLGRREDFRERFEIPMQSRANSPEQARLVRRLSPFILRRTKAEVAKELPEKIEQVSYVELTSKQKAMYQSLLSAARQTLSDTRKSGGKGQGKMAVFTALLRLRQVCCDPRLLTAAEEQDPTEGDPNSAKIELLDELLQDAIGDGHHVLVFSQFASMLGLIRESLKQSNIDYCYLDGSTRDRQREVDRFQTGTVPVFLISLKAGGVGLNLTAADTVIHYDPWWNPAVEAQATDRAHRIGQHRTVNVYKLITRGTVEERILSLQAKKRELTAGLVDSENPIMSGLTDDDLSELLK